MRFAANRLSDALRSRALLASRWVLAIAFSLSISQKKDLFNSDYIVAREGVFLIVFALRSRVLPWAGSASPRGGYEQESTL